MKLPEMGTLKNGNEDGHSHHRSAPNGQKSDCKIREVSGNYDNIFLLLDLSYFLLNI